VCRRGGERLFLALTLCGSRSVCLSLWKVDDAATALLMQRVYANLLGKREGLTVGRTGPGYLGEDGSGMRPEDGFMPIFKCISEVELRAFQLGELPERLAEAVTRHLEECPACEALARRLDALSDPILRLVRQPPGTGSRPAQAGVWTGRTLTQEIASSAAPAAGQIVANVAQVPGYTSGLLQVTERTGLGPFHSSPAAMHDGLPWSAYRRHPRQVEYTAVVAPGEPPPMGGCRGQGLGIAEFFGC
jgi:hypothetical protein